MTPYPQDSAQAVARLLALAVTADGVPADMELKMLESRGVLLSLGLSRDDFDEVMDALCADLRSTAPLDMNGFIKLSNKQLVQLLDEIRDPGMQRQIARLLFDIFSADHRMVRAESILLWEALDHWGLHLREVAGLGHGQAHAADSLLLRAQGVLV